MKKGSPGLPKLQGWHAGVLLFAIAFVLFVSLLVPKRGYITDWMVRQVMAAFGIGGYLVPILFGWAGAMFIAREVRDRSRLRWKPFVGFFVVFVSVEAFFAVASEGAGGYFGNGLWVALDESFGPAGAASILAFMAAFGIVLMFDVPPGRLFALLTGLPTAVRNKLHHIPEEPEPLFPAEEKEEASAPLLKKLVGKLREEKEGGQEEEKLVPRIIGAGGKKEGKEKKAPKPEPRKPAAPTVPPVQVTDTGQVWQLPKIEDILEEATESQINEEMLRERARIIEETLLSFGVPVQVVEVNRGPTVTQFGVRPGYVEKRTSSGKVERVKVKVSKIQSLANDLSLALAAAPLRIEAPVPGKSIVGIEVPNLQVSLVSLRGIMESEQYVRMKSRLRLPLGRDVSGTPVVADLTKMPHLLVAGATGSGKSVCINSILVSLLLTNTPETLRLFLVDPKRVELTGYNGIPHLIAPVEVEPKQVVKSLRWMVGEMDRRYRLFAEVGVRDIERFNKKASTTGKKPLPYILLVIDELADLMLASPDEVENQITRLAQMARATGIHLIIATQRPSVDVVTGLIKANFPARVAFAVTSQVDSRVILDMPGAEHLLGRGDMLFMAPDSSKPVRLQGAFVSDVEIRRTVRYWKGIRGETPEHSSEAPGEERAPMSPLWEELKEEPKRDVLFDDAVEVVRKSGRASISLLQRKLRIGYTRAARLIDQLEEAGIVGPDEGVKGRKVLVDGDNE